MKIKGVVIVRYSDGDVYNRYPSAELEDLVYNGQTYIGFRVFNKERNAWDYYSNQYQWEVEAE